MNLLNEIQMAQRNAGEEAVIRHLEQQGLGSVGNYASEEETKALLVPDTSTDAEKRLHQLIKAESVPELCGSDYPQALYKAALKLAGQPLSQTGPVTAITRYEILKMARAAGLEEEFVVDPQSEQRFRLFAQIAVSALAPQPSQKEPEQQTAVLVDLLGEVRQCFTRDDGLPDDILPRIDAAIRAIQGMEEKT